jgi:sporulation protein YlmC with PRC-barrel domain
VKRFIAMTALSITLAMPAYAANKELKPFSTTQEEVGDIYASELIGKRVYATDKNVTEKSYTTGAESDWDDIGEVDDIIMTEAGEVKAVILGVGGFLGLGERDIAVNMSSLNMVRESDDDDDFFLVVNTDKDKLMNAPAYKRSAASARKTEPVEMADKDAKPAEMTDRKDQPTSEMADKDTTGMTSPPAIKRDGYREVDAKDVTAEMLEGAPVYGADNKEVGEVDRLLKNDSGKLDGVVIDVGGYLGMGEHPVAFDVKELKVLRKDDGDDVLIIVDSTKSALEKKPKYQG